MATNAQPVSKARILVVDDEATARFAVGDFLEAHGFEVETVSSALIAQMAFRQRRPQAVILDYLLADANAMELLAHFKSIDANVPVLILTGHGSVDLAVRVLKAGADQFMTKPMDLPSLLLLLRREIENYSNRQSSAG